MKRFLYLAPFIAMIVYLLSTSTQASFIVEQKYALRGVAQFEQAYTVTCQAIGCPPSVPYYQLVLKQTNNSQVSKATVYTIKSAVGMQAKPAFLTYKGTRIAEGDTLVIDATWSEIPGTGNIWTSKVQSVQSL